MKYAVLGLAIVSSCPDNAPFAPSSNYIVQVEGTSYWSGTIGTRMVSGQHSMAFSIPNEDICWNITQRGRGQLKVFATLPTYIQSEKFVFPKWGYAETDADGNTLRGCFLHK